jgi:hypothetical protein
MRISATLATVVGAGVGLVAAGATYAATAGQSPTPSPVSAVAPQAVTTTVQPTAGSTCDGGAVLKHDVCVVTIDRAVLAPRTQADSHAAARTAATSAGTTRASSDDSTEHAQPEDDATEHANGDDDGDDHGEHAEDGDDHGDDHGGQDDHDGDDH